MQPSDGNRRSEERTRPPLLNGLILVTLATIAVAVWYLGYYYLGNAPTHRVRWFAPAPFCQVLDRACTARLGRTGELTTRITFRKRQLDVDVHVRHLEAQTLLATLEGRTEYIGERHVRLHSLGQGHYIATLPLLNCQQSSGRWRLRVQVVDASGRRRGSWYDFDHTCRENP